MAKIRDLITCKVSRSKYNECYPEFRDNTRFLEFKNLLMNSITIDGLDFPTETFVKNQLIDVGQVGYDRLANQWSAVYGEGINKLRNPTKLFFVLPNFTAYYRDAYYTPSPDGAYLIKAMPNQYSLSNMIDNACKVLDECDISIMQNLKANRTPFYFVVNDDDTRLSIEHAIEQTQNGKPVVVVNNLVSNSIQGIPTNPQWLVDKIETFKTQVRDYLFNRLGILTANVNKRERVQVGEVNATVGQCVDYIYLIIDTFNKQMETYDLPYYMHLNNALEEYYGSNQIEENNENEVNIND